MTSITKKALPTNGLQSSPDIWISEKRNLDSSLWGTSEKFWIVQNKAYDLSKFAQIHPGGKQWIELTRGHDITQHFVVHHLNQNKARAVLSKYFVSDAPNPQKPRFTFEENGLYRQIKRKLLSKYSVEELQNTSNSTKDGIFLLIVWMLLLASTIYFQSYIFAILCGLSIFPLLGVGHNFIHMKQHPFRHLYLLAGFTTRQLQIMHCISHHLYPNTLLDYQIRAIQPIIYYLRSLPSNSISMGIAKQVTLSLTSIVNIIMRLIITPITEQTLPNLLYCIPLLQIPLIYFFTQNFFLSAKLFATIQISLSCIFLRLPAYTHKTGFQWTDGDQQIEDFAQHHIYATTDSKTNEACGVQSFSLYVGLNFHAIHHLFPTIDNYYLPKADKILVQEAAKRNIRKNEVSSIIQGLIEVEKNFYNRKTWKKSL